MVRPQVGSVERVPRLRALRTTKVCPSRVSKARWPGGIEVGEWVGGAL